MAREDYSDEKGALATNGCGRNHWLQVRLPKSQPNLARLRSCRALPGVWGLARLLQSARRMGNRKSTTQHRDHSGLAFVELLIAFLPTYTIFSCLAQAGLPCALRLVERAIGGEA